MCWKDPRTSLLLPSGVRPSTGRSQRSSASGTPSRSLSRSKRRDAIVLPTGLALWERYTRSAVSGLAGLPVYVSDYDDALAGAAEWRHRISAWLETLGIDVRLQPSPEPGGPLDSALRHFRAGDDDDPVAAAQLSLYNDLRAVRGSHASFSFQPASAESPWTTQNLEARGDVLRMWRSMEWLSNELAGHVPLPSTQREVPDGVAHYCMNATEDDDRYHAWLSAQGEPPCLPAGPPANVTVRDGNLASSAGSIGRALHRAGVRHELWRSRPQRDGGPHDPAHPAPTRRPQFSVIVWCQAPAPRHLDRCVASVVAQTDSDWQMCLCDDASGHSAIQHLVARLSADDRYRTTTRASAGGAAAALNAALLLATGRYVVFLGADDELHPSALARIAQILDGRPETDVVYTDEDQVDEHGWRTRPVFKPGWSPDLLLSNPYMGHALAVRKDLVSELGGFRSEFDGAEQYDLMLRLAEVTAAIAHVPEVLYHRRQQTSAPAVAATGDGVLPPDAGQRALEATARRRGSDASVVPHPRVAGSYHFVRHPASRPLVSAIIPFRDEPSLTAACYRAFLDHPGYDEFELLLVDNDSALPETRALLEELGRDHRVRSIAAPGPFDWVAINNEAVRKARGELLLFLNNDVVPRSQDWLAHLVAQAERPEVGAVGARLLYPDGTDPARRRRRWRVRRIDPRPTRDQRRAPRVHGAHHPHAQCLGSHRSLPHDVPLGLRGSGRF